MQLIYWTYGGKGICFPIIFSTSWLIDLQKIVIFPQPHQICQYVALCSPHLQHIADALHFGDPHRSPVPLVLKFIVMFPKAKLQDTYCPNWLTKAHWSSVTSESKSFSHVLWLQSFTFSNSTKIWYTFDNDSLIDPNSKTFSNSVNRWKKNPYSP